MIGLRDHISYTQNSGFCSHFSQVDVKDLRHFSVQTK